MTSTNVREAQSEGEPRRQVGSLRKWARVIITGPASPVSVEWAPESLKTHEITPGTFVGGGLPSRPRGETIPGWKEAS